MTTIDLPLPFFSEKVLGFIYHGQDIQNLNGLGAPRADDQSFNELALTLFKLQFSENAPYRQFCISRKCEPQSVKHWSEIPAMPVSGFKEFELTCIPSENRTAVFHSSGTTGQRLSRHFHCKDSLEVYEASVKTWFAPHFEQSEFVFLTPSPEAAPHSSLVHMFKTLGKDSLFAGTFGADGWEVDGTLVIEKLGETIEQDRPLTIYGTAFNFVHLLDHLEAKRLNFKLPEGSCVLETGGYKGRSRTLPKSELHALITKWLGVPNSRIVCEYGMSELSSQAYDTVIWQNETNRIFHFPPWARAQIVSPETGREVAEGETGLIRLFDLANVYSVMAIQTEDLGVRRGGGFELLGRAALSEPRGCSLMSR